MAMTWIFGEKCIRCNKQRTKRTFEGLPTCEECEAKIRVTTETKRRCPQDGQEMNKEVRLNVVIDRCPSCKGVWLDGGELELIQKGLEESADDEFIDGMLIGMIGKGS